MGLAGILLGLALLMGLAFRAVVTLLAVCSSTHAKSYVDIVMAGIGSALLALIVVIVLGSLLGSF